jgi:uncharacterized protein DUF2442
MVNRDEFRKATSRAASLRATQPAALAARYDRRSDRVIVSLASGLDIGFAPHAAQGLERARPADLAAIEVSPSGFGLHFPKLDADIYLPALLDGILGSRNWMAAHLGTLGGRTKSSAKAAAARRNGRLGGRPRKKTAA